MHFVANLCESCTLRIPTHVEGSIKVELKIG
jgi:hypothetical protein